MNASSDTGVHSAVGLHRAALEGLWSVDLATSTALDTVLATLQAMVQPFVSATKAGVDSHAAKRSASRNALMVAYAMLSLVSANVNWALLGQHALKSCVPVSATLTKTRARVLVTTTKCGASVSQDGWVVTVATLPVHLLIRERSAVVTDSAISRISGASAT